MQRTIIGKFAYLIWWDQINKKLAHFQEMLNANTGKLYDFEMLQTGLQYVGWKAVLNYTRILKFCIKWLFLSYTSEI